MFTIENACGVTGGRSPKVFPKTRDRKERGTRKGADLAPMCVSGLVGPRLGLSRGSFGAVLGRLGAVLGLSWSVLGRLGDVLGMSWPALGLSWSWGCLGLSWASFVGSWGPRGGITARRCWPTSFPRSPKTMRKWIPKTNLFVTCSGSVFGLPSGLVFGRVSGRLGPQK